MPASTNKLSITVPTPGLAGSAANAPETPIEAVARLRPLIEELRPRFDSERCLPAELVEEMARPGLFDLLGPAALGGLELEPLAASDVVEALAAVDGSVGWCSMISSQGMWSTAFLSPEAVDELFPKRREGLAGALKPGGKAVKVEGGYSVTGRWAMASGITHSGCVYGSGIVHDPASPAQPGDVPALRILYLPAAQVTVHDTWHTSGLRGTGSNDFSVTDVFVPEQHTLRFPTFTAPYQPGPLYRDGYQNLIFVCQAAQQLGVARGATESFIAHAREKVRWVSTSVLRNNNVTQLRAAEAHILVQSARAWLHSAARDAWAGILAGQPPSQEQRLAVRLAITHAIHAGAEAVSILHTAAGADAIYEANLLHRQFEDSRTALAHVQATPAILETAGAMLLGNEVAVTPALF